MPNLLIWAIDLGTSQPFRKGQANAKRRSSHNGNGSDGQWLTGHWHLSKVRQLRS